MTLTFYSNEIIDLAPTHHIVMSDDCVWYLPEYKALLERYSDRLGQNAFMRFIQVYLSHLNPIKTCDKHLTRDRKTKGIITICKDSQLSLDFWHYLETGKLRVILTFDSHTIEYSPVRARESLISRYSPGKGSSGIFLTMPKAMFYIDHIE